MSFPFLLWLSHSQVMNKGRFHFGLVIRANWIKLKITPNPLWLLLLIFLLSCCILLLSGRGRSCSPTLGYLAYSSFIFPLTHWVLRMSLSIGSHRSRASCSSVSLSGCQGSRAMTLTPQQSRSADQASLRALSTLSTPWPPLPPSSACGSVALFFWNGFSYTDGPFPWNREWHWKPSFYSCFLISLSVQRLNSWTCASFSCGVETWISTWWNNRF